MLVKELAGKGISDSRVLDAMAKVPRHFFFDPIFVEHAYEDKAFPIGEGQTISQPYTVAFQTMLLELNSGHRVLEIGTGSGYQACILLELGVDVYTIEYNEVLYRRTRKFLPKIGYKPHFFWGDGSQGLPDYAPYDGIIVTAGAPTIPQELVTQLKVGGRLIIPVGDGKSQTMYKLTKLDGNKVAKKTFNQFSFVPLRGEKGWK